MQNLVQIGTVVSEKIQFEFLYVLDLGPRSRNDIDLQYLYFFIYLIRCLLLLTFRSLAAIVSEKSTVFTFPTEKPKLLNLTAVKQVKVSPGSSFEQTMISWSPQCYIPSFVENGPPVPDVKIFEGFYNIWASRPSWSCDQHHVKIFISLYLKAFI